MSGKGPVSLSSSVILALQYGRNGRPSGAVRAVSAGSGDPAGRSELDTFGHQEGESSTRGTGEAGTEARLDADHAAPDRGDDRAVEGHEEPSDRRLKRGVGIGSPPAWFARSCRAETMSTGM